MISKEQIIEAAGKATDFPQYSEYEGNWEFTPPELTRFAQHFYKQGLLDGAEKCDVHARGWDSSPGNNRMAGYIASNNCAEAIRQMAESCSTGTTCETEVGK